ncbi:expressed unknown protein [Seminavis robusta]|uniref:Uncharacterized protein n=1 Tax=Seminavis robusta TaxID=568900 RepID=A0A9N8E3W7_9STRA|nr:expressed unknown protein [Seminavis robusta]|eukprot:Sro624_g177260.1 n/a (266) ;mRNA; r:5655-6774
MADHEEELDDVTPEQEAAQSEDQAEYLKSQSSMNYAGIIASSIILLVSLTAGGSFEGHRYYGYGIAVASIAMIVSVAGWFLATRVAGQAQNVVYINYFLFAWNFIGAAFLTFGGPFDVTGNGYFGAWGLVVFATMALGVTADTLHSTASTSGPTAGLFCAAVVLLVAISAHGLKTSRDWFAELLYSLMVSILTILITGAMLRGIEIFHDITFPIMCMFSVLWVTAAILLTFRGPFLSTGNGYFAGWGGALMSVYATMAARRTAEA